MSARKEFAKKNHDKVSKKKKKKRKIAKVMHEFGSGKLKSSSGQVVTNQRQAVAIAMSEAGMSRKKG